MIRSKALHEPEEKKRGKIAEAIHSWWIESTLGDWYHNVRWFFVKPYKKIKKLVQWQINVFNNDYDFDAHCLFAIIEYKLKRVYPVLEKGHAIQEDVDMKALKLAIKLAGRLKDDDYESREFARHDRKWGELKSRHDRVASRDAKGKPTSYYWDSWREKANTPELEEQERKEFRESMDRSYAAMQRDQARLYGILSKYLRRWWD